MCKVCSWAPILASQVSALALVSVFVSLSRFGFLMLLSRILLCLPTDFVLLLWSEAHFKMLLIWHLAQFLCFSWNCFVLTLRFYYGYLTLFPLLAREWLPRKVNLQASWDQCPTLKWTFSCRSQFLSWFCLFQLLFQVLPFLILRQFLLKLFPLTVLFFLWTQFASFKTKYWKQSRHP